MNTTNREIHLKSRPEGMPSAENFELVETSVPEPSDGQFVTRNIWMTVDPYMRGRMYDMKSYVPPFQVGEVLDGGAVGQVIVSKHPDFAVGDYVSGMTGGWREYALSDGFGLQKVDPNIAPLSYHLGILGMPGMTAYAGLLRVAEYKEGDTVFVSAASGAVGSVVCQIAKLKGSRVIGSAGSDEKCTWLKEELGVDEAINYKTCGDLTAALAKAAPEGIDIYFENVGGTHLEAALACANQKARFALCGMIDSYNDMASATGPSNIIQAVGKELTLRGFIVSSHLDMAEDFIRDMATWIGSGQLKYKETVLDGIENAPQAFINLFTGANQGKMLVRLGPDNPSGSA